MSNKKSVVLRSLWQTEEYINHIRGMIFASRLFQYRQAEKNLEKAWNHEVDLYCDLIGMTKGRARLIRMVYDNLWEDYLDEFWKENE